jgi:hypothetical protein
VIEGSCLYFLLPFLEQTNLYNLSGGRATNVKRTPLKNFICPSDGSSWPAGQYLTDLGNGATSYLDNVYVFNPLGQKSIIQAMPNGTSNTMAWGEHIIACANAGYPRGGNDNFGIGWGFNIAIDQGGDIDNNCYGCNSAFGFWGTCIDYDQSGILFQVAPSPNNCDPRTLSSAHLGGMVVGLGDASVRFVAAGISASTWYAVNDPVVGQIFFGNAGYIPGPDW